MKKILTGLLIAFTGSLTAQTTYDRTQDKSITASSTVIGELVQKKFLGINKDHFTEINGILNLKTTTPDLSKFDMWMGAIDQRVITLEASLSTLNNRQIDSGKVYRADLTRLSIRISGAGQRIDNLGLTYATKQELAGQIEALKKQLAEMQTVIDKQAAKFQRLAAALID